MPQLRSFTGFAPSPSLPDAYKTGYDINQQQQQIDQRGQIARDEIANRFAIAEMENASKRAALQQQALMQAQELEVQKSLKQQALGLQARELEQQQALAQQQMALTGRHYDTEAQKTGVVVDQAARKYEAQQRMRMAVQQAISEGKSPTEAFQGAAAVFGTEAGADIRDITGTRAGGAGAAGPMATPTAMDLLDEHGNPTGQQIYQASPNRFATLPAKKEAPTESTPVPGSEGRLLKFGNKTFESPAYADLKELKKERDTLSKKLESDAFMMERSAYEKSLDPNNELSAAKKSLAKKYADEKAKLDALEAKIAAGVAPRIPTGLDTGATTNKIGRFKVIQRAR